MKIDCDRVLILSDRLAQLSNVCYEKAEEIHIEKLRIAENSLMDEILKNLENDRKQLEEQAEKLKRYGIDTSHFVGSAKTHKNLLKRKKHYSFHLVYDENAKTRTSDKTKPNNAIKNCPGLKLYI